MHVDRASGAASGSIDGALHHIAQLHPLHGFVVASGRGEFDEFVDEIGEFARLAVEIGEQPLALGRVERVDALAQDGDVGAQAGEGCAQFVAGVLHQSLLGIAASSQRVEHAAERASEPTGLVGAVDGHGHIEPSGRRNR